MDEEDFRLLSMPSSVLESMAETTTKKKESSSSVDSLASDMASASITDEKDGDAEKQEGAQSPQVEFESKSTRLYYASRSASSEDDAHVFKKPQPREKPRDLAEKAAKASALKSPERVEKVKKVPTRKAPSPPIGPKPKKLDRIDGSPGVINSPVPAPRKSVATSKKEE